MADSIIMHFLQPRTLAEKGPVKKSIRKSSKIDSGKKILF